MSDLTPRRVPRTPYLTAAGYWVQLAPADPRPAGARMGAFVTRNGHECIELTDEPNRAGSFAPPL